MPAPVSSDAAGAHRRREQRQEILRHALHRGAFFPSGSLSSESRSEVTMFVKQIMTQPVATCNPDSTLHQAAQLLWDHDCGVLPVVDSEGRAVAMLTDRDICMAAYTQGRSLSEIRVSSAMSKQLYSCTPEDSVKDAEHVMQDKQIRRIPVVDASGRPVGMLSLNDLACMAVKQPTANGATTELSAVAVTRTLAAVCAHRAQDLVAQR